MKIVRILVQTGHLSTSAALSNLFKPSKKDVNEAAPLHQLTYSLTNLDGRFTSHSFASIRFVIVNQDVAALRTDGIDEQLDSSTTEMPVGSAVRRTHRSTMLEVFLRCPFVHRSTCLLIM